MSNDVEQTLEVLQPSALHALEKAQIDVQVATAHQWPRSLEQFKRRALTLATLDEETAESCMYSRPVGKEQDASGKWVQKFAEGASIRLAEIVAASYGNVRVASRVIEQTDRFVKCEGVAHDLESNYAAKSECIEVTVKKDGTPYSENQRALMAKVALAKAFRDAIFRVVPKALAKPVYDAAKQVALGKGKTMQQRITKLQDWLKSIKVEESRAFSALSVTGWADITESHMETLTGLRTAIRDGEVSISEAFPPVVPGPEPSRPAGAVPPPQPKRSRKAQAEPPPVTTPPETPKPAPALAVNQHQAPQEEMFSDGEPVTEPEGESAPAPTPPATQPAPVTPDPAAADPQLVVRTGESDGLGRLKTLCRQSFVTQKQVMAWARHNKHAKESQTALSDLAEMKLQTMVASFNAILPEIKKFPA